MEAAYLQKHLHTRISSRHWIQKTTILSFKILHLFNNAVSEAEVKICVNAYQYVRGRVYWKTQYKLKLGETDENHSTGNK
jgi:hypothetical protein